MSSHSKFLSYFAELLSDLDDAHVSYDALRSRLDALERAIDDRLSDDTLQRRIQDLEVRLQELQNKVDSRLCELEAQMSAGTHVDQVHSVNLRSLEERLQALEAKFSPSTHDQPATSAPSEAPVVQPFVIDAPGKYVFRDGQVVDVYRREPGYSKSPYVWAYKLLDCNGNPYENTVVSSGTFWSDVDPATSQNPKDVVARYVEPVVQSVPAAEVPVAPDIQEAPSHHAPVDEVAYDWSSIPEEYDYAVTDADGTQSYFYLEPEIPNRELFWFAHYADTVQPRRTSQDIPVDESRCPNWKSSLRKRPAPVVPESAPLVVEGGMYLTADHEVVGPMSPATNPKFPGQLQGRCNGDSDVLYYFLPNGNYYPEGHPYSSYNSYPRNRILRPLVDYRPDYPRDPQFAPGSIPGSENDPLTKGKKFRLTGEFRIPREDEFWVSGNLGMSGSNWNLQSHTFEKPHVISTRTYPSLGKYPEDAEDDRRLIAVEYPISESDD